MTTVVADKTLLAQMRAATGPIFFVDEEGKPLGGFDPKLLPTEYMGNDLVFETEAELEAYLATATLVSAADVEQRLRELRKCS